MADDAVLNDLEALGRQARRAQRILALASTAEKNAALDSMAHRLRKLAPDIVDANARDVSRAKEAGLRDSLIDRLRLDSSRIDAIAESIFAIRALADPVGQVMAEWQRPNGLRIARVRVPIGVIGVIFESRPDRKSVV